MSDSLKSNSTLTTLELDSTAIDDLGACMLSDSLKSNSSLTTLTLSNNPIDDLGFSALSDSLKSNSTLTKLDLGTSTLGSELESWIHSEIDLNYGLCAI